ncbi:hypothetical protein HMPREF9296_1240 [Prevotella disiens FB035-09AN]|uniref:Uncharacterized protein n=1 Tax=Prevotella disiens FB035-09AN TaxID=866771 RepID=E1KPI1_9BACT|nr:hypothetical protein HMPREF9296_1240 [Prevotella disiens FB035-09AN]
MKTNDACFSVLLSSYQMEQGRRYVLNLYTPKKYYINIFKE